MQNIKYLSILSDYDCIKTKLCFENFITNYKQIVSVNFIIRNDAEVAFFWPVDKQADGTNVITKLYQKVLKHLSTQLLYRPCRRSKRTFFLAPVNIKLFSDL